MPGSGACHAPSRRREFVSCAWSGCPGPQPITKHPPRPMSLYPTMDSLSSSRNPFDEQQPLPPGWQAEVEPNSNVTYWVNTETGDMVFDRPSVAAHQPSPPPPPPPPVPLPIRAAQAHAPPPSEDHPRWPQSAAVAQPHAVPQPYAAPAPALPAEAASAAPATPSAPLPSLQLTLSGAGARLSSSIISVRTAVFGAPPPPDTPEGVRERRRARARRPVPSSLRVRADGHWEAVLEATSAPAPRVRSASVHGPYASEAEAEAARRHDVPPMWDDEASCLRCGQGFGLVRRRHHCRNCGCAVCDGCSHRWPTRSLPPLYVEGDQDRSVLRGANCRVCLECEAAAQVSASECL